MLVWPRSRHLVVVSLLLVVTTLLVVFTYSPAPSRIRPPRPVRHRFVAKQGYPPERGSAAKERIVSKHRFVSSQRHRSDYVSTTNSVSAKNSLVGKIGDWMKSRVNYLRNATKLFGALSSKGKLIKKFLSHEMEAKEKAVMIDLFRKLWDVKKANNFTMFLYGGTLLGSWRHHGMIPYDDDVDTASPAEIRKPLFKALKQLEPTYKVVESYGRFKLFSPTHSTHKTGRPWKWPFVDLQFYYENKTHIWDISEFFSHYKYPKSEIFPLKLRPFEGEWYEAPKHVLNFQKLYYEDLKRCGTGTWNHMLEMPVKSTSIKCDDLKDIWPFVTVRKTVNGRYVEVLTRGNETIREVVFPT